MTHSLDAIKIAVATLITVVVITIVLLLSRMLNSATNSAADSAITTVVNYDIAKYDGKTISGEEVQYLIEKLQDKNIYIRVITNANPSGFTNQIAIGRYNIHAFDDMYYRDSDKYINGQGNFVVTLGYDSNDVFYGIMFKQV